MWELIWLMVIMKIPIVYLCWVVYWAVKSEPRPEESAALVKASDDTDPTPCRGTGKESELQQLARSVLDRRSGC